MIFNVCLEFRTKKKCEKTLLSKLKSEVVSPCNGVNYHLGNLKDVESCPTGSILPWLLRETFGDGQLFCDNDDGYFRLAGIVHGKESYEFASLRLFEAISQYLEDGSYLSINGKGIEISGGQAELF